MQKLSSRRDTFLSFQPPAIGEEEIEAVAETLRSGWLTSGPRTEELERRFGEYVGARHAIALASGTAAMHLSLVAAGVGPGDEVVTTPITWPATANVIVHCGARPVFADVRESDLNVDPDAVAAAVTPRTKAILPVHLAGQPCDLDPLHALGLPVIEDAAHATESAYRGRKVGALSLATCFSLYATKNVAAGEGGMVTTDDDEVAAAIRNLRLMRRGEGSLYDVTVAGFKANLSDVLAAIALCQLGKIDAHAEIRRRHVAAYDTAVAELPGIEPLARDPRDRHALHLYVVRIDADVAARPGRLAETLSRFAACERGVLLGTQMVAKGHHFEGVALAAVVDADTAMALPDLRAEERTFQLVTQLAGRSGRDAPGRVLVQTYQPDARPIALAARHAVEEFLAGEVARRRELGYPPFRHLVRVVVAGPGDAAPTRLLAELRAGLERAEVDADLLGPAPLLRLRGRHRAQILAKTGFPRAVASRAARLLAAAAPAMRRDGLTASVDVDPQGVS